MTQRAQSALSEPEPASTVVSVASGTVRSVKRAADTLVDALIEAGVDTFFGIPGGPISPVFDAILGCSKARLIESRQETAAVFAAMGFHRATGRVPCVVVTAGPGATNAVTGVVAAHLERVPMLVIAGDVAWAREGGLLLQDSGSGGIDVEALLRGATRRTLRVAQPGSAKTQALAAISAAQNPLRPGPVLLSVPIHLATPSVSAPSVQLDEVRVSFEPDQACVAQTVRMLQAAQHPLLVFGAGGRPHRAVLERLVERLRIPFVTTPRAKGVVSELNQWSLRNGGLAASRWARRYCEQGVDCALVLGTDLDDCSIGTTRYVKPDGDLIHVDFDANVFGRNLPASLGIVTDLGSFAAALVEAAGAPEGAAFQEELRRLKCEPAFDVPEFASAIAQRLAPYRALSDLEKAAGESALFVTDIGEHMLFALHYLTAAAPQRFTIHLGLGSMGSGICSSIGLSLGRPGTRVVCICGDGGMQMLGMELSVALKQRLPVVFAVFNDGRYNMVYHGHKQVYGREAPWATPFIDFSSWAPALGVPARLIESPGQVTEELLDELGRNGPCLLDIRIDRDLRFVGGGRNEALQHMSMPHEAKGSVR